MTDRTSAGIFCQVFTELRRLHEGASIARTIWLLSMRYDFHPADMGCDGTLIHFGLAKWGIDPEEDGMPRRIFYADADKNQWDRVIVEDFPYDDC